VISLSRALYGAAVVLAAAGACRRAADERPVAALSSSAEMEGRFDDLRARWIDGTPEVRASMRGELNALVIELDKRGDGLEPIVRAYLAISWLYAGVPAAVDGPPGVANDLGTLVKGVAIRKLGKPREAIELLRPLIGKLIDPFARPLLYEEITEAFLDDGRYEDAVVYAEGWLRSAGTTEKKETRAAIARVLHRIPDTVALKMLEADAVAPPEAKYSPDMLMFLTARVDEGSSAVATADGGVAGDGGALAASDAATTVATAPTTATVVPLVLPIRFDPRSIGVLVPATAPGWSTAASAVVRAAAAVATPALATALHSDGGVDANEPNTLGHRLAVLDTGGTAQGVARALDAAEREGAGVIIGGLTDGEANALAALAQSRRIATILLRKPSVLPPMAPGEKQAWIALGMSASEEAKATLDAAPKGSEVATVLPWPEPGAAAPPDDPLRARCDATPKVAGGTAFPVAAWRTRKVATVIVLGDARCARRLADEIAATANPPWRPTLVLSPSALDLAHVVFAFPRVVVAPGVLPAGDDAPPALRTLWTDQGAPVSLFGALGHDAAALAASALPGDLPPTIETAPLQKNRVITIGRLFSAKAALWTTAAAGPGPAGLVTHTLHTRTIAAHSALRPMWAPP